MEFRQLTEGELATAAREHAEHSTWKQWSELIRRYYGPAAHRVSFDLDSEYDDEGGSYKTLSSLTVFAQDSTRLDPDEAAIAAGKLEHPSEADEVARYYGDDPNEFVRAVAFCDTPDFDSDEMLLDAEPTLTFPTLYVPAA